MAAQRSPRTLQVKEEVNMEKLWSQIIVMVNVLTISAVFSMF